MLVMSPGHSLDSDDLRTDQSADARELRRSLRLLPQRPVSPDLSVRLRVLASKESARRRSRASWGQLMQTWKSDLQLWANNLMRPLAIPTAGGFLSALLLFGVLAPTLATPAMRVSDGDVPTVLYSSASVRSFYPFGFDDEDLTVEVTIDGDGRVIDYSLPNGAAKSESMNRNIENYLLFTQFKPVTNFGQPVRAKVRISFQSSRIEVKG